MEGEEKKKNWPQKEHLKPLGSGQLTPEEEYEIRKKGAMSTNKARRRNADIRAAVRAVANMSSKGKKKSLDIEKMLSIEQFDEDGAPMIAKLVYTQFMMALNGDKEARDWICKMLGIEDIVAEAVKGLTVTADADALEKSGGVAIHLIRGEKPHEDESEEDMATRAANRLAVVEAMKAIGESADKIGQSVADHVSGVLNSEGVNPDG